MTLMARVRAVSSGWPGAPGLNTFYFQQGDGSSFLASDAQLCADRVRAAFLELINTFPIGHVVTVDPVVDVLDPADGELQASYGVDPPAPTSGIAISGFQAIAAMLLASYHTSGIVNGHRVSGRSFIGPVAEQQDTNGTPNADQSAKLTLFGEALLSVGLGGPNLVVWSRPVPAPTPPATTPAARAGSAHVVTSITNRDFYAVLRSRRD